MRKIIASAIVFSLLIGSVVAGPTIIFTDTGAYVMTVGADGVPVTERADEVLDKRTGAPPPNPGPGPTPPPDTPPPTASDVAKRAETAARSVNDAEGCAVLAAVYELLSSAKLVPNAYDGNDNALTRSLDLTLMHYDIKKPGSKSRWAPFRASMTDLLNEEKSKGKLSKTADWVRVLHDISVGLTAAGGGNAKAVVQALAAMVREYQETGAITAASLPANVSPAITDILTFIMTILPLILQILQQFFGGF